MRAGTRADTAEFSWQAQKQGRNDGRYARYRDFQYLALSGEYLRICSRIFHLGCVLLPDAHPVPMIFSLGIPNEVVGISYQNLFIFW
jgi:hypothetical protein